MTASGPKRPANRRATRRSGSSLRSSPSASDPIDAHTVHRQATAAYARPSPATPRRRSRRDLASGPKQPGADQIHGHRVVSQRCLTRWPFSAPRGHSVRDDGIEHRRLQRGRLRPLPGGQDRRARAWRLLPDAGRRDGSVARALAIGPRDPRTAGDQCRTAGRGRGLHCADGGPASHHRRMAATRRRRWRQGRGDRCHVQRAKVGLDRVGARRFVAARSSRRTQGPSSALSGICASRSRWCAAATTARSSRSGPRT
jgi:hypothetical protein